MKTWVIAAVLGMIAITATIISQQSTAADDKVTISGSFFYRERIVPPPGSAGLVVLQDISRADAVARTLARQEIDLSKASSPYDYALTLEADALEPSKLYAVRITIRDADNHLLWTTDTVHSVASQNQDQQLEPIMLIRVNAAADKATATGFLGHDWQVTTVDGKKKPENTMPFIRFGVDGTLSGKAGCNSFSGAYKKTDNMVSFGPLALTRRACLPVIQEFESQFLTVFTGDLTITVDGNTLTLTNTDNRQILATRD